MPKICKTVKIGFVGAGFIGQLAHIDNYARIEGCELYALAEKRPELRKKVIERYGISKGYQNHRELLADPEVEAVVVVTPRPQTGIIALDCLKFGKHVFTEKPMAHTLDQAKRLVEAAHKKELIFAVGYMKRFDEGVEKAKQMLDEVLARKELGRIVFARAHCFMGDSYCKCSGHVVTDEEIHYTEDSKWPIAPEWLPMEMHRDYAWFLNVYVHNINLLRYLLEQTPEVEYAQLDDQLGQVTVFEFDGFPGVLESGQFDYRSWDELTEIYFERGRLRIETPPALLRNVPARVELYRGGENHQIISPQCDWTWSFQRQAEAFINSIKTRSKPLNSCEDSIEDIALVERIWQKHLHRK